MITFEKVRLMVKHCGLVPSRRFVVYFGPRLIRVLRSLDTK